MVLCFQESSAIKQKMTEFNTGYGSRLSPENLETPGHSRRELLKGLAGAAIASGIGGFWLGKTAAEIVDSRRLSEGGDQTQLEEYESAEQILADLTELPPSEVATYIDELCDNSGQLDRPENEHALVAESGRGWSEYHADRLGFNLPEIHEALSAIEYANTPEEVIEGFDLFTRQFGAESTLAESWRYPELSAEVREGFYHNMSDLDILKSRFRLITAKLSVLPMELYELTGVKNFHFTEFTDAPIKTASGEMMKAGANALMDGSGKLSFSLDGIYEGRVGEFTFYHELGHLADERLSKGYSSARMDEGFNALNRPGFEYYGVLHDELDEQGFIRPYSAYNILEDKAIVFENMLSGIDFHLAGRSADPIVKRKYRLQMARLEAHVPSIAEYLSRHGYHGAVAPRNPYSPLWGQGAVAEQHQGLVAV